MSKHTSIMISTTTDGLDPTMPTNVIAAIHQIAEHLQSFEGIKGEGWNVFILFNFTDAELIEVA